MRLSDAQVHALCELSNVRALTVIGAQTIVGRGYKRTLRILLDWGLARYRPYADLGGGAYTITPAGRQMVKRLVETGRAVRESTAQGGDAKGCVRDPDPPRGGQ